MLNKKIGPQPRALIYQGKVYCLAHLPVQAWRPDVTTLGAITEWRSYPQCHKCGKYHTHGITLAKPSKGASRKRNP